MEDKLHIIDKGTSLLWEENRNFFENIDTSKFTRNRIFMIN